MGRTRSPILLYMGAVALGAGLAYWQGGGPRQQVEHEGQENRWVLPGEALDAPAEQAYRRLKKLAPWGRRASGKGPDRVTWKLLGTSIDGTSQHALVQSDGAIQRLAVGAALPDGSILRAIERDAIELDSEKGRRKVRLYQ